MSAPRPCGVRWPLQPLYDALNLDQSGLAVRLDLDRTKIRRAETEGLSDVTADHWAIRAGLHPAQVWGIAWYDAAVGPETLHNHRPAPDVVAERIRDLITSGEFAPGDPLPTVALAARFNVGDRTVTRALAQLHADGWTARGVRRRIVVADEPPTWTAEAS